MSRYERFTSAVQALRGAESNVLVIATMLAENSTPQILDKLRMALSDLERCKTELRLVAANTSPEQVA